MNHQLSIAIGGPLLPYEQSSISKTRVDQEIEAAICGNSAVATIFEGVETRYSELDVITRRGAARVAGVEGNPVVGVCVRPSDKLVHLLVSILRGGSAYLPIDPACPRERLSHILSDAQLKLLVVDDDRVAIDLSVASETGTNVAVRTVGQILAPGTADEGSPGTHRNGPSDGGVRRRLGADENGNNDGAGSREEEQKSDICIVLYTSGSTGVPKGTLLSHRAVLNRLRWQFQTFPYADDEVRCCFKTALTFVDSVSEIFGPLCRGRTVVVIPKATLTDPENLVRTLEANDFRRLVLVPSLLRLILARAAEIADEELPVNAQSRSNGSGYSLANGNHSKQILPRLGLWICSGETLVPELVLRFFAAFPDGKRLCNFYGSTEVMGDVLYEILTSGKDAVKKFSRSKVPIGIPVSNTIVYLLDEQLKPVMRGEMGQIWVAGKNLANGYIGSGAVGKKSGVGKEEVNRTKFRPNPYETFNTDYATLYETGDYARMTPEGVLVFEGRVDSQVKVRGHRVDLSEIEAAFKDCPGLTKVVVLCYKPGHPQQALVAFCSVSMVANGNGLPSTLSDQGNGEVEAAIADKLTHYVRDRVPEYMTPFVVVLDEIPLLPNGKTDRQALLRLFRDRSTCPLVGNQQVDEHRRSKTTLEVSDGNSAGAEDGYPDDPAAKSVLNVVRSVLGSSLTGSRSLKLKDNFFHVGGNSLNAVAVCLALKDAGLPISISEFLTAADFEGIATTVSQKLQRRKGVRRTEDGRQNQEFQHGVPSGQTRRSSKLQANGIQLDESDAEISNPGAGSEGNDENSNADPESAYRVSQLQDGDRGPVSSLIAESFFAKSDLEKCLKDLKLSDYDVLLRQVWNDLLRQGLSFVVRRNRDNVIVGAALNFDLEEEPDIEPPAGLRPVLELLESVEAPQKAFIFAPRNKLKVVHNFIMGTCMHQVTDKENVELMYLMEEQNIEVAKRRGYNAVFTTNTSPTTQQLAETLGYEMLDDLQVNTFVDEHGGMPFLSAPANVRALCCVKYLTGPRVQGTILDRNRGRPCCR